MAIIRRVVCIRNIQILDIELYQNSAGSLIQCIFAWLFITVIKSKKVIVSFYMAK